jgi:hypothetical protein
MQNAFGGKLGEEWLRIDFAAPAAYFNRNTIENTAVDSDRRYANRGHLGE